MRPTDSIPKSINRYVTNASSSMGEKLSVFAHAQHFLMEVRDMRFARDLELAAAVDVVSLGRTVDHLLRHE
jgi:hypothetical protein